jgi:hypothetical protein
MKPLSGSLAFMIRLVWFGLVWFGLVWFTKSFLTTIARQLS